MKSCGGIRADNARAAAKEKRKRPRRRVKAGCEQCKYGQHTAHFVQTWMGMPAEIVVVAGCMRAYVNVHYDGRTVSIDGEANLRALAAAILEALDTP